MSLHEDRRTEWVQFRATRQEKHDLEAAASQAGKDLSTFLRDRGKPERSGGSEARIDPRQGEAKTGAAVRREATSPPSEERTRAKEPAKEPPRAVDQAELDRLIQQLKGQGMTGPVARREAREQLGA